MGMDLRVIGEWNWSISGLRSSHRMNGIRKAKMHGKHTFLVSSQCRRSLEDW